MLSGQAAWRDATSLKNRGLTQFEHLFKFSCHTPLTFFFTTALFSKLRELCFAPSCFLMLHNGIMCLVWGISSAGFKGCFHNKCGLEHSLFY